MDERLDGFPLKEARCRVSTGLAVLLLALSPWVGAQQAASAPAGTVSILAADANALTLSTDTTALRQRLTLIVEHPTKGEALQLRAAVLAGPGGVAAPVTLTRGALAGPAITLPDTGSDGLPLDVDLSASLPRAGDYSGYLVLRLGDAAPVVRTLKVTRSIPKVPVTVLGTLRAQSPWTSWREVHLRLPLLGPLDHDIQVTPSLADLAAGANGQLAAQTRVAPWRIVDASGRPASAPYTVRKGLPLALELEFSGFDQTGEHKGRLLLAADDQEAAGFDFTLLVRDPAWLAAVLIAIGAGVSMALRRYVGGERPRLVLRRRIVGLREDIAQIRRDDNALGDAGLAVLDDFLRRLDTLDAGTRGPDAPTAEWLTSSETELSQLQDKLVAFAAWIGACRHLDALQAPNQTAAQKTKLDEIGAALRANGELGDALQKSLAALPGELAEIRRQLVVAAFDELRTEAEAQQAVALPGQASSPDWAALFGAVKRGSALAARGEFAAALGEFAAARGLYGTRLIEDLQARLAPPEPPRAMTNWDEVVKQAGALLKTARGLIATDPDAAIDAYTAAYRVYLDALIDPLLRETGDEAALAARLKDFAADKQAALRTAAGLAATGLREAAKALAQDRLRAAWAAYDKAYGDWQAARVTARGVSVTLGNRSPEAALAFGAGLPRLADGGTAAAGPALPTARESSAELTARTAQLDRWVDVAAVVVATLLGLNFVWAANASWGGLGDWMVALLWGLGVHQVSGYTFDGVLGLRDKLVK